MLISCREADLPAGEFDFIAERLIVRPLRATQIRAFIGNYLNEDEGARDGLFWRIAGGDALRSGWEARPADSGDEGLDRFVEGEPGAAPWLDGAARSAWQAACASPVREYALATNPFMLLLLLNVWRADRDQRFRQRADLFETFTRLCLRAELDKRGRPAEREIDPAQNVLATLAAHLQRLAEREEARGRDAATLALPWKELADAERRVAEFALGARLLRREGGLLRFRHQLLQEFYLAFHLAQAIDAGESALLASTWGERTALWERSGWEQAFLLLADYRPMDVPALLRLLVRIQPEVAGAVWEQTRRQNPALLSDGLGEELRAALIAGMLPGKPGKDFPRREAAFGRGLGLMHAVDGRPQDRRPGVWGWYDRSSGRAEVDIDWVPIPAGPFVYQGQAARIDEPFAISRHPITHSQFRAFVDDPRGYADPRWWGDAPDGKRQLAWGPWFPYGNHPAVGVSWWAAMAFCRWLSVARRESITLPTEREWERAAAGSNGRAFPWGEGWDGSRANAEGRIGMPSPVGLFARGASAEGVHDLAGNVREWTLHLFREGRDSGPWRSEGGSPGRAVRGGSWDLPSEFCRAASRYGLRPVFRYAFLGFRVVCCPI